MHCNGVISWDKEPEDVSQLLQRAFEFVLWTMSCLVSDASITSKIGLFFSFFLIWLWLQNWNRKMHTCLIISCQSKNLDQMQEYVLLISLPLIDSLLLGFLSQTYGFLTTHDICLCVYIYINICLEHFQI